jgi:hypothetical protein
MMKVIGMARFRYNSKVRPQPQTTMHILEADYQYLMESKEFSNQPAYDILHKKLLRLEELRETQFFLEESNRVRSEYRRELDMLRNERIELETLAKERQLLLNENNKLKSIVSVFTHNAWR